MRVLHTSDLHGRYKPLLRALEADDFDVWIDTGDLLPNPNRNTAGFDWHATNRRHQVRWLRFKSIARRLTAALRGRPAILVRGNHDFISLAPQLRACGATAHELTAGASVTLDGLTFAGFGEVVRHRGRWSGEVEQGGFWPLVEATFEAAPDVLCTHSPAYGVLDHVDAEVETEDAHTGIRALADRLATTDHRVRWHLFGHVHESADRVVERGGIWYRNGALTLQVVELSP